MPAWKTSSGSVLSYNRKVRAFLLFTRRNHRIGDIEVPDQLRRRGTRTSIEEDHRWALVRRLLDDDSVAVQDRVAGLLLLLFGQPLSKLARLTRDQITHDHAGTRIMLGAEPLDLPSPLDDLVRQLADNRHDHTVLGHTDNHPWLFPRGAPGHPITPSHLMIRLQPLGIHADASEYSRQDEGREE
jgi:integrase